MTPLPEERLLALIRGQAPRTAQETKRSALPRAAAAQSPAFPRGRNPRSPRWSHLAVGALSLILLIELASLLLLALRPQPAVPIPAIAAARPPEPVRPSPGPLERLPSFAEAAPRALFAAPGSGGSDAPAPGAGLSAAAKQLASRLTLTGIISGEPAQAVIEDAQTKKTYFVGVGHVVVDDAILEQVLSNRVILNLSGERIELTL